MAEDLEPAPWEQPQGNLEPAPWEQQEPMSWGQTAVSAVKNVPESAVQFGKNIVQPIIHPVETAQNIGAIGGGVLQQLGLMRGEEYKPYSQAVGKFLMDRYGSVEGIKQTLATDPVGMAADVSMLLTGGGGLAARAPGVMGRIGEIAATAGRAVDPLRAAEKAATGAASVAAIPLGQFTGTGGEALREAARAGREGGAPAGAFLEHMRGVAPMDEVVRDARAAVGNLKQVKNANYRTGIANIDDSRPIDITDLDQVLHNAQLVKVFKGQNISPVTTQATMKIMDTVNDWKKLDPTEYHTALGLDALKQKIGDIRSGTEYGSPERLVADKVYNGIRQMIVDNDPEYAKVMKGYEIGKETIGEIERTLAGKPGASIDTSLRKLQSVLRNNVNANYGNRARLAEYLQNAGAPNLMKKLAGQMLTSPTPRGLHTLGMSLPMELAAYIFGGGGLHGIGTAMATMPLASPRLMGEASYYAGKTLPEIRKFGMPAFQIGRVENPQGLKNGGRVTKSFRVKGA